MIDYTLPLDELPDPLPIMPLTKPFDVTITPPGSKSITNRAYVLAALADGESRIIRPLRADDTDLLLKALCTLGAEARWQGEDVLIKGVNGRFPRGGEINLGDGGTPTRFMIAAACLAAEPVVVDGSKRMRERPIAEGVDMLRQLGAQIEYVEEEGRLPVRVIPSDRFKGGEIEIGKTQSSQFISALLLIGATLEQGLHLRYQAELTSASYVAMTYRMLGQWGIRAHHSSSEEMVLTGHRIARSSYGGRTICIEPDASSAVYWWTAAFACRSSRTETLGITRQSYQSDVELLYFIHAAFAGDTFLGSAVDWRRNSVVASSPCNISNWLDCKHTPDGAVALSVLCAVTPPRKLEDLPPSARPGAVLRESYTITGLHTLRVKECDRLAALETELRKVGCEVETAIDSITIHPISGLGSAGVPARLDDASPDSAEAGEDARATQPQKTGEDARAPQPIIIETYNDHRMAMAFAVLGLRVPGIQIRNPAVVSKSYPTFWKDFAKLYG